MQPNIDEAYCKGCNICVAICPVRVFSEGESPSSRGFIVPRSDHPEKCVDRRRGPGKKKCELCIYVCPDQAITWTNE